MRANEKKIRNIQSLGTHATFERIRKNLQKPEMNQFHKYYFALKKAKVFDKKVRKRPCLLLLRDTLDSDDLNEQWMDAKKLKLIKKTLLLKDTSENH